MLMHEVRQQFASGGENDTRREMLDGAAEPGAGERAMPGASRRSPPPPQVGACRSTCALDASAHQVPGRKPIAMRRPLVVHDSLATDKSRASLVSLCPAANNSAITKADDCHHEAPVDKLFLH